MMDWFSIFPAVLVGFLLLFTPGALLGLALGLRRLWLLSLAPAFTTTMFALAAVVLPFLGIAWSLASALGFSLVFGVLVFLLYRFVLKSQFNDRNETVQRWPTILGWALSGSLLTVYLAVGVVHPENISQTFDNVFHLNAIAYITETASASPLTIGGLTMPDGGQSFYPLAWHSLVQLVQQATGVSIAVAINAMNIVIVSSVWPLGMMLMTRQFAGNSRAVTLASAILAAAFPAFPLNMLSYGVLYPYFAGLALVPVAVATVLQLLGLTRDRPIATRIGLGVLLLGLIPGLVLSHPVALMTVLALSVPAVLVAVFSNWGELDREGRLMRFIGLSAYLAVGLVLLILLRPGVMWGARATTVDALWRILTLSLEGYGFQILLAALTLLGAVLSVRRKDRVGIVAAGGWVLISVLYFLAAGLNEGVIRAITGVWYGDAPRLGAIMPIVATPLIVISVMWLITLTKKLHRSGVFEAVILITLLLVTQLSAGYASFLPVMRQIHTTNDQSVLLTNDERKLLDRLPDIVPPDEMIVGSPWTGTALAYAFSGRKVAIPHMLITPGPDRDEIMDSLDQAYRYPDVCEAVERLNVRWYLDFGEVEVHGAVHTYPGLDELEENGIVEFVAEEGEARLFRIVACATN